MRQPTPEQEAAIDGRRPRGAGRGGRRDRQDRRDGRPLLPPRLRRGVSPDAMLAFTFTDKAAAELRQRIRAALARRAPRPAPGAPASCSAAIGGAWVTTIHGFCNRLLAGHPVAAGIDPGFRVLDAPEAERAAGEAFDEALRSSSPAATAERERTVAAYEIDGLRAMVVGAHEELRSRGVAAPRCPSRRRRPAAAVRRAAAAAAEALEELPTSRAASWSSGRADAGRRARRRASTSWRALRTDSKAKADGRLPRGDRRGHRPRRRGRRGRRRLPPPRRAARALRRRFEAVKERRARDRLRGPAAARRRPARAGRDRQRLPRPLQPPARRRVPGHQPAPAAADRGAARAARPG